MSHGNVYDEMRRSVPCDPVTSTDVFPMFETQDGIVVGITKITATATLTALCESVSMKFAPLGIVYCINSAAAISCHVYNAGVATAPTFTSLVS